MHAQAGVHHADQDISGDARVPGRSRTASVVALVLLNATPLISVIERRVVHHRRIAGLIRRRAGIAATARLARPDRRLAESGVLTAVLTALFWTGSISLKSSGTSAL